MGSKTKVFREAARHGAWVVINSDRPLPLDVCIDAPPGMIWRSCDAHALAQGQGGGMQTSDVWNSLLDGMSDGLRPCRKADCEHCLEHKRENNP